MREKLYLPININLADKRSKLDFKGGKMESISFKVGSVYCYDCIMALQRFIGSLDGVESIEVVDEERVGISFDPALISEERLREIVIDSIDKLGIKIQW